MTSGNDDNCKLPKDSVSKGDIEMKYGFVNGEVRECGYTKIIYNNEEELDKTTEMLIHPTGDHEVLESNKKKKAIKLSAQSGEHRHYTAGGHSVHADGHYDHNSESTSRFESAGDMGHATGKNKLTGIKGQEVKASGGKFNHTSGSSAVNGTGSSGTIRISGEKDYFKHIQGDMVSMGEKNSVQVVKKDIATYSGANWDTFIKQKGKMETGQTLLVQTGGDATVNSAAKVLIKAKSVANVTGQEINLKADSKITLTVGGSSITIESGSITIKSSSIKFEQG